MTAIRNLIAILVLSALAHPTQAAERPHIVMILADDMGYGDVTANNPNSQIPTPNLDRLANEGMRFTDAHSGGSSCIPSRYALMTGRFAVRASMRLADGPLIDEGRMTVASMLRDQGYATAMVGKWHLGFDPYLQDQQNPADYSLPLTGGPVDTGFDRFFGMHASLDLPPYFYIRDRRPVTAPTERTDANDSQGTEENWNNIQGAFWRAGQISPDVEFDAVTPRFIDESIEVIESHANEANERPLFLYLALPSPHTPWLPLERFRGQSGAGMYGDFMMQVDFGIGRLLDALAASGMEGDTLVLFSSDNGPVWYDKDREKFGHDAVGGLRGMKFSSWEGGHRMPFLVRWPGTVAPGSVCEQMVSFADVLATFAEITDLGVISEGMAEDSVSFAPYLKDSNQPNIGRAPIVHNRSAIRDGDWKYIEQGGRRGAAKGPELYNLRTDLGEQDNLLEAQPEIADRLKQRLRDFLTAAQTP